MQTGVQGKSLFFYIPFPLHYYSSLWKKSDIYAACSFSVVHNIHSMTRQNTCFLYELLPANPICINQIKRQKHFSGHFAVFYSTIRFIFLLICPT